MKISAKRIPGIHVQDIYRSAVDIGKEGRKGGVDMIGIVAEILVTFVIIIANFALQAVRSDASRLLPRYIHSNKTCNRWDYQSFKRLFPFRSVSAPASAFSIFS